MKKVIFALIALLIIAGLLFVNYGGFYLLQGTWVCQDVRSSLVDTGSSQAMFSLANWLGAAVTLRFTLGKVYFSANGFGMYSGEKEFDYLAQTGRLIIGDWALHFRIRKNELILSNTAGDQLVFQKVSGN